MFMTNLPRRRVILHSPGMVNFTLRRRKRMPANDAMAPVKTAAHHTLVADKYRLLHGRLHQARAMVREFVPLHRGAQC
jgi:hypothetical protein